MKNEESERTRQKERKWSGRHRIFAAGWGEGRREGSRDDLAEGSLSLLPKPSTTASPPAPLSFFLLHAPSAFLFPFSLWLSCSLLFFFFRSLLGLSRLGRGKADRKILGLLFSNRGRIFRTLATQADSSPDPFPLQDPRSNKEKKNEKE